MSDIAMTIECEHIDMGSNRLFRCRHSANIYNDKMYVFGGQNQELNATNQLWQLDLSELL